jgi:archaellum component FlaC
VQKAIQAVTNNLDKIEAAARKAGGAAGDLSGVIKDQSTVLEAAKKKYASYVLAGDEGTEQAKKLASEITELSQDLKQNKDKLAEAENAANALDKSFEGAGEEAKKAGPKFAALGNVLKGVAATMGVVATAAAAAAVKLGVEVVEQFGELEQNLGGSEAVFGKHASTIQKIGEDAYKNLGLSQSEYLANANKMGALFQGSGVSQQKSLEMTTQAMQRAADMASVMGIDTASAMEAVTGAAKGNYTMIKCQSGASVMVRSACVNAYQRCAA